MKSVYVCLHDAHVHKHLYIVRVAQMVMREPHTLGDQQCETRNTNAVGSFKFGRLEREGIESIDQLATSACGRRKGWGGRQCPTKASARNVFYRLFQWPLRCDLAPSSPVQARATGPSRSEREERRGGGAGVNGVGGITSRRSFGQNVLFPSD